MQEFQPEITEYGFVGDLHSLGSLQLTKLARGFEVVEQGQLDDLFPDTMINERTIVVEQQIEGLGIMPIVRFGVPGGGFVEDDRIRQFSVAPVAVREEDFIEQALINQLRKPGTFNEQWDPKQIVERRIQKLVNRHKRTVDLFRAKILQGGISYTDPRTNYAVNVRTNIPDHNFFDYNGWGGDGIANVAVNGLVQGYRANQAMTNTKGRPEAFWFRSTDERFGVPWTDDKADLSYTIRQIKQFLLNTNKNTYTELIIHSDLMTVLQENNLVKSYMGLPAALGVGATEFMPTRNMPNQGFITLGPGGDLASLGGLRIRVINGLYRDPVDNVIKHWWPVNKVAIVAKNHMNDASATLGLTQHCVGESPDGAPGVYIRMSGDKEPPSPPGRVMQLGDAFMPFAVYPEWICILKVCEEDDLRATSILQSDLGYGTF